MANKLFYSYIHGTDYKNDSFVPSKMIYSYWDSLIFDVNHRTIWHQGMPFGNVYPGTLSYGEIFNDLQNNIALGAYSHAEGYSTIAKSNYSHAEGYKTFVNGVNGHVEGNSSYSLGENSHAEGNFSYSKGINSHAEGDKSEAQGRNSHAEGFITYAIGEDSHAEGNNTYAKAKGSHSEGNITKLQQELSLKSSNNTNQVYVIKEADKMNLNAANSLLKFIEEPEENIYGILITTNKKSLLSTILSRCQIIELKVEKENNYNLEDINNSLSFLTLIHEEKENSIAYLKSRYLNIYATRDDILKSFQILENLIDKEINRRNGIIDNNFSFYDIIETSLQEITLKELIFYLDKIIVMKNKLIENPYLNLNLFLDRLIIEISEVKI